MAKTEIRLEQFQETPLRRKSHNSQFPDQNLALGRLFTTRRGSSTASIPKSRKIAIMPVSDSSVTNLCPDKSRWKGLPNIRQQVSSVQMNSDFDNISCFEQRDRGDCSRVEYCCSELIPMSVDVNYLTFASTRVVLEGKMARIQALSCLLESRL
jgi:hypothetical protein